MRKTTTTTMMGPRLFVYTCGPASLIPKRIRPRDIIYMGGAARRGRDDSDGDGGGNGGGAAGDGDGGEAAPCRGCSRSRLASSRI